MTSEITISEELGHFIRERTNDHYALQIILFFADHPCARFNELAIIHALNQDNGRHCLQKALRELVDQGVIKTCSGSNVLLYSLAEDMRSPVLELKKLARCQRQLLPNPNFVKKGARLFQHRPAAAPSGMPNTEAAGRQSAVTSDQKLQLYEGVPSLAANAAP